MPALVAGIHALMHQEEGVDGRDKPGHDGIGDSI
jgi:2-oxoglutarate ferredoxin oxidoreductase subunit beta